MSIDDRNSDHDLKAYLDGRDGVSAAYHKMAQDQPPAALDRLILDAAREHVQPASRHWYRTRSTYALAASVMIAVAGLSLYPGRVDDVLDAAESVQPKPDETVEIPRLERAAIQQNETEEARGAELELAPAAFADRQLPPPVPAIGAAGAPATPAVSAEATASTDALARRAEAPAIVIDGPLLESIEADAAAAQAQRQDVATNALQEIVVTGSRIMRRDQGDLSYRDTRETWLDEIRNMADELDARSRLITARRSAAVLEQQLEEEIELFLEAYPDSDIDAELEE